MSHLIENIIAAEPDDIAVAIGAAAESARGNPDEFVPHIPKLLVCLQTKAMGPPGPPHLDRGEVPVRIWECLTIVHWIKGFQQLIPSLFEAHFVPLLTLLSALSKKEAPQSDAPWGSFVADVIGLWSPQICTIPVRIEEAFPIVTAFVSKEVLKIQQHL